MPPAIGPPVLKRYSSLPLRASSTSRLPSRSPVSRTSPAVGVTAAYMGVGDLTRQRILPVVGSTALIQPCHFSIGSFLPQPLESPVYGTVATHWGSGPSLNSVHQSMAFTYSKPVLALCAGPFHCTPATGHTRTPSGVSGRSALRRVVTGSLNASLPSSRLTTCSTPSFPAAATIFLPAASNSDTTVVSQS